LKILLWTQYFWPEHFHINEVATSLQEAGEDVTVLTGKPNYPGGAIFDGYRASGVDKQAHAGMDVVRLPLRPRAASTALDLALNYLSFIASGYLLGPLALRGRRFDVVFVYAPSPLLQALPAIFFAWTRGVPLVLWVQDLWPEALTSTGFVRNRLLLEAIKRVVRYIYRRADLLLIPSEAFRDSIERLGGDPNKVRFHPNSSRPVPIQETLSDDTQRLVQSVRNQFSIVYAGNIGTVQALDTVVAAASLLKDQDGVRFYIVGNGTMASSVADEIHRLGLGNIEMPGWVSPNEIQAVYDAASVLLLCMKDDEEIAQTIPNKLQVYMAAGKPIIVSGNGEPARVLAQARAGLVAPAGDARALADAVMNLRRLPPDQRAMLGENGLKWFSRHFEIGQRTLALIAYLQKAVAEKKRKPSTWTRFVHARLSGRGSDRRDQKD
jgi:glycosyltransferase involved in cell wall biosynthesis